jgi:hypothetical protein
MANTQLDQFVHALWWNAVPVIFLAGVVGLILREVVEWLGRCIGRALRSGRDRSRVTASSNLRDGSAKRREDGGLRTEDTRQKSEVRSQRTEGGEREES